MNSVILSYILGRLTKIADISPNDIHTDLRKGKLDIDNISLRKDTINSLLPLAIEQGKIPKLNIKIPDPRGHDPLRVVASDATVDLPLDDILKTNTEITKDSALENITNLTILGTLSSSSREGEDPAKAQDGDEDSDLDEPENGADMVSELGSVSSHGSDEDNYASCVSDGEQSDGGSTTGGSSPVDSSKGGETRKGLMSYLISRVSSSVEWIWQRQVRIEFKNITLNVPSDFRQNIYFSVNVENFDVVIEPAQEIVNNEKLKVVTLTFSGATVMACTNEAKSKIVSVNDLEVKLTSVFDKNGNLSRKNTAVLFNSTSRVCADEGSLYALLKCHLTRQLMLSLPKYCRPFSMLRKERSLWHYAMCCVVAQVHDRHMRFNSNLSHIRVYTQSRRRYLVLLEECHRKQDVEQFKEEMAELELRLRFPDVILFLRQLIQEKFGASPSQEWSLVEEQAAQDGVHTSLHLYWKEIVIDLPCLNSIAAREISVATRNEGNNISVGEIALYHKDKSQVLNSSTPLFLMESSFARGSTSSRIVLSPIYFQLKSHEVISCLHPVVELSGKLLANDRSRNLLLSSSSPPPSRSVSQVKVREEVAPTPRPGTPRAGQRKEADVSIKENHRTTVIVAAPSVSIKFDEFLLDVEGVSFITTSVSANSNWYGCVVSKLAVEWRNTFLLVPVEVRMDPDTNNIIVSEIHLSVSPAMWIVFKEIYADAKRMVDAVPVELFTAPAASSIAGGLQHQPIVSYERISKWLKPSLYKIAENKRGQYVLLKGVRLIFESFQELSVNVSNIQCALAPTQMTRGELVTGVSIKSVRITMQGISENVRVSLLVDFGGGCMASLWRCPNPVTLVCIPSLSCVLGKEGSETAVPLLSANTIKVVSLEQYVLIDTPEIVVLDGARLSNFAALLEMDPTAVPSTQHPYKSSKNQLFLQLDSVDVQKLCTVPLHTLVDFGTPVMSFILSELVSESMYELFFSGFCDAGLQLLAKDAEIQGYNGNTFKLNFSCSTDQMLNKIGLPLLPGLKEGGIILIADVRKLALHLETDSVSVCVSGVSSDENEVRFELSIKDFQACFPIGKETFWNEKTRSIPSPALKCSAQSVAVLCDVLSADHAEKSSSARIADLSIDSLYFSRYFKEMSGASIDAADKNVCAEITLGTSHKQIKTNSRSTSTAIAATPKRVSIISQLGNESDSTSVSGAEEERALPCFQDISVHGWEATLHRAEPELFWSVAEFFSEMRTFVVFNYYNLTEAYIEDRHLDLDRLATVLFQLPDGIMNVERCTFTTKSASRFLTVGEKTTVVFKNCGFYCPTASKDDIIKVNASSAFYVTDSCIFCPPVDPPGTTPTSSELEPVEKKKSPDTFWNVSCDGGRLAVELPLESFMEFKHKTITVQSRISDSTQKLQFTLMNLRGNLRTTVCEFVLFELGKNELLAALHAKKSRLMLSMQIICSKVFEIPLVSFILDPFTIGVQSFRKRAAEYKPSYVPFADAYALNKNSNSTNGFNNFFQSLKKYKVECYISKINIRFVTISNIVVGGLTISKIFAYAHKNLSEECGMIEANFGVEHIKLLDPHENLFYDVLSQPFFFFVDSTVNSECLFIKLRSKALEVLLTSKQLHFIAFIVKTMQFWDVPFAGELENQMGTEFALRDPNSLQLLQGNKTEDGGSNCEQLKAWIPALPTYILSLQEDSLAVGPISSASGQADEQFTEEFQPRVWENCLYSREYVFDSKAHLHLRIDQSLVQRIVVRTCIQVENRTGLILWIGSNRSSAFSKVSPFTLGCASAKLLDSQDIWLRFQIRGSEKQENVNAKESRVYTLHNILWNATKSSSAAHFAQWVYERENFDIVKSFVSEVDGSSFYIRISVERNGPLRTLVIRPAMMPIKNCTPMRLELSAHDASTRELLQTLSLEAGAEATLDMVNPDTKVLLRAVFSTGVKKMFFELTDESFKLSQRSAWDEYMLFNSVSLDGDDNEDVCPTLQLRLKTVNMNGLLLPQLQLIFGKVLTLTNWTSESLQAGYSEETCKTLEIGGDASFATLAPLQLYFSEKTSAFTTISAEVYSPSFEGEVLTFPGKTCYGEFLLLSSDSSGKPVQGDDAVRWNILPPLIIQNESNNTIFMQHSIYPSSNKNKKACMAAYAETISSIPGSSQKSTSLLAKSGFIDTFAFSCSDCFNHEIETTMCVGTSWKGIVPCDGGHYHAVGVYKSELLEPARIVVGKSRFAPLRLVNLSSVSFLNVRSHSVASMLTSDEQQVLQLRHKTLPPLNIDLTDSRKFSKVGRPNIRIAREKDLISVYIYDSVTTSALQEAEEDERSFRVSVNAGFDGLSVTMTCTTIADAYLRFRLRNVSCNVDVADGLSPLLSVVGIEAVVFAQNREHVVIVPFNINASFQNILLTEALQRVDSVTLRCSKISVTLSDYLLFFGMELVSQLLLQSFTDAPLANVSPSVLHWSPQPQSQLSLKRMFISSLEVAINWDRGFYPSVPYVLSDIPFLSLIPSVNNLVFRFPSFASEESGRLQEYFPKLKSFYVSQGIQQLPSAVTNISFFKNSVLGIAGKAFRFFVGSDEFQEE